jgi:hypothetical protein
MEAADSSPEQAHMALTARVAPTLTASSPAMVRKLTVASGEEDDLPRTPQPALVDARSLARSHSAPW